LILKGVKKLYRVTDRIVHTFDDGDKVETFRLEGINKADRWGVDWYIDEKLSYVFRYDSEQEAIEKFNRLIKE
jgi:hypothetical protein